MSDPQRTVDEIRFFLQADDQELTDGLRELATDYAAAVREVNARLRRCGEYLKQGLRSEAIHLAEAEPNLLDSVALLDFPERDDWDGIVATYQLPKADPLLLDVAEELNEAYAVEQPLQKVLAKHRRLALARAPLNQRLAVMRKLAELDPESTFWEDDLRDFETARFGEIETTARQAAEAGDTETLDALASEIKEGPWLQRPPTSVTKTVRKLARRVAQIQGRRRLEELEPALNAAFGELDIQRARRLRDAWNAAAEAARLGENDPLYQRAEPALGWVEDEDRKAARESAYQHAVAKLERRLDGQPSLRELERLGHEVGKAGRNIPEPLGTRYRNRLESLQLAEQRRRYVLIGAGAGLAAVFVGLVAFIIYSQWRAVQVDRVVASVQELMDNGQLQEADQRLQEFTTQYSGATGSERIVELRTRLSKALAQERQRTSRFEDAVAIAKEASEYDRARKALRRAEALAEGDSEQSLVERLNAQWEQRHQQAMAEQERKFTEHADEIGSAISRLERLAESAPLQQHTSDLLRETDRDIVQLKEEGRSLRSELQNDAEFLQSRLAAVRDRIETVRTKKRIEEQITEAALIAGDPPQARERVSGFIDALESYTEALPDDPRTSDLQRCLEEADYWKGVFAWQKIVGQWQSLEPDDRQTAQQRSGECRRFLAEYPGCPSAAVAERYQNYMGAIMRRRGAGDSSEKGIQEQMLELFSQPLVADVWMLQTEDGARYYLNEQVDLTGEKAAVIKYIADFDATLGSESLRTSELQFSKAVPAPQTKLAQRVLDTLPQLQLSEWEPFFLQTAERIRQAADVDPFLRYVLLRKTLELAAASSPFLGEELAGHLDVLEDEKIDLAARWMHPGDERAADSRKRAAERLKRLPELKPAWKAAERRREQLEKTVFRRASLVGWLRRNGDNKWECRTVWNPDTHYPLRIIVETKSQAEWKPVGSANPEGLTIRTADRADLCEGRPVFVFDLEQGEMVSLSR